MKKVFWIVLLTAAILSVSFFIQGMEDALVITLAIGGAIAFFWALIFIATIENTTTVEQLPVGAMYKILHRDEKPSGEVVLRLQEFAEVDGYFEFIGSEFLCVAEEKYSGNILKVYENEEGAKRLETYGI